MSLTQFKKGIMKTGQLLSEKIGTAKPTKLDDKFLKIEKHFKSYYDLFVNLENNCEYMLYPNGDKRIFVDKENAVVSTKTRTNYTRAESSISVSCLKHGDVLTDYPMRDVLLSMGKTFQNIEEYNIQDEERMKQDFLLRLKMIRRIDMKKILKHRKDIETYRLCYDALKRQYTNGSKTVEKHLKAAKAKYLEKKIFVQTEMEDFLKSEDTGLPALMQFLSIRTNYHQKCYETLNDFFSKFTNLDTGVEPNSSKYQYRDSSSAIDISSEGSVSSIEKTDNEDDYDSDETGDDTWQPQCRALYDYPGSDSDDLPMCQGDIVFIIREVDDDWYLGELDGRRGLVPKNYVELIVPICE